MGPMSVVSLLGPSDPQSVALRRGGEAGGVLDKGISLIHVGTKRVLSQEGGVTTTTTTNPSHLLSSHWRRVEAREEGGRKGLGMLT